MVGVGIVETASARFHVPHLIRERLIYFRSVLERDPEDRRAIARGTIDAHDISRARCRFSPNARFQFPAPVYDIRPHRDISGMFRAPYVMCHCEKLEKWYIAIWEDERGEKCINKDLSPSPIIPGSLSPHLLALKDWLAYDLAPTLKSFRSAANKTVVFPAIDFWVQSRPPTCTARSIVCERLLLFVSTRPLCEYNANILIDGRGGAIEVL